ncbi:MAG: GNAT family N-acetyltransferase [Gemmatimonadaceae bacterium]|nr:GNAT family N-acetyltransferase [Gemmatimonadaceae bacterium]
MKYRLASPADLPALAQMRWDFRAEAGEAPRESFDSFRARYTRLVDEEIRAGRLAYWIAEQDDEIVAHIAVFRILGIPRPMRTSDQWGYVTDCYTRPAARGMGAGSALLQRVQAWARELDFELLLVAPGDLAEFFYRRAGFVDATSFRQCQLRSFDESDDHADENGIPGLV